jgi:hypothetical protein
MKSTENLVKYWLKLLIMQGNAFRDGRPTVYRKYRNPHVSYTIRFLSPS